MKFVRIVQVEFSQPTLEPHSRGFEIDGVAITIRPRDPDKTEIRRLLVAAEVPLENRPDTDGDRKIVISDNVTRKAEKAIELTADLLAVTNFSARTISAAVPTAGFSSLTADDRRWIAESTGLRQISSRLQLSPVSVEITQDMLSDLDDRADGVALLGEALANDHETGRFRELARFFERAFRAAPLRGFRLEWLHGREENQTEQVGRSARCGLAGVWVLQDPSLCGPARRVRQG
jgi:hypothetical protein